MNDIWTQVEARKIFRDSMECCLYGNNDKAWKLWLRRVDLKGLIPVRGRKWSRK